MNRQLLAEGYTPEEVLPTDSISTMSDQQLRLVIAREVLGWTNVSCDESGNITNTSPRMLTTVPPTAPNWINNERGLAHLESSVSRRVGTVGYRSALGLIAGDFNPSPTRRQRCEDGGNPFILILLCLPKDRTQWLEMGNDHMILRHSSYWHYMRDGEISANGDTRRVKIPVAQRFTPESVVQLLTLSRNGELK